MTSRDSHATEEDKELDKELERDKEKDIDKNLSSNNSATLTLRMSNLRNGGNFTTRRKIRRCLY